MIKLVSKKPGAVQGFVSVKLIEATSGEELSADHIVNFARRCLIGKEELFRIYYYDCWPYDRIEQHPVTRDEIDFSKTAKYQQQQQLFQELELKNHVAFRRGELNFQGWGLTKRAVRSLLKSPRAIEEKDYEPILRQKGVDIKIGLDIAWLSSKRIVDKIVLVTADSDLVPAMKFARREGIQVVLVTMDHKLIKKDLKIHADEVRDVKLV